MQKISATFTIYFEAPFWIGICTTSVADQIQMAKVTFGAEPKQSEVQQFILEKWHTLRFYQATVKHEATKKINPKKQQRLNKRLVMQQGVGTKSMEIMKEQMQSDKVSSKKMSKKKNKDEAIKRYLMKQQKKQTKKRGH